MSNTIDEISSQPQVWTEAAELAEHAAERGFFGLPGEAVLFLGCGTSAFIASSIAALREGAGLGLTDWAYASEWQPHRPYDRIVAITRSGTTSEVLSAMEAAAASTSPAVLMAITAVSGEAIDTLVDATLTLEMADERSVVQTRFPTTVLTMARAAFSLAHDAPAEATRALEDALPIEVSAFEHFVYLGTGWGYGLAQEAALKIREAAQAWSEAYPLLDYRHGPIAVAGARSLVFVFGPVDDHLVRDIEETGATVHHDGLDPLVQLVQAQRVAVALAESRGLDPDHPRHLSRSVILD